MVSKRFVLLLLHAGIAVAHAASAPYQASGATSQDSSLQTRRDGVGDGISKRAGRLSTIKVIRVPLRQAYDRYIRKALVPYIMSMFRRASQNYGLSPYHRLARKWHEVLMLQLRAANIPDTWKQMASRLHKELGGKGDLLKALPPPGAKGSQLNMSSGLLREEFISYATFFLRAFVSRGIEECGSKDEIDGVECVDKYREQLQVALISTLTSLFEYIVPRTPSFRIVTISFVLAAVSPCPFGFLAEPDFVYKALYGASTESLEHYASIQRVLSEKPCPENKKVLINVLMANGVTPADFAAAKKLESEFATLAASARRSVDAHSKKIKDAGTFDPKKILKNASKAPPSLHSHDDVLAELDKHLKVMSNQGQGSLETLESWQNLGDETEKSTTTKAAPAFSDDYVERLRVFLTGQSAVALKLPEVEISDLIKELEQEIGAEAKANPSRAALKPASKDGPLADQAMEVLYKMRNFNDIRPSTFVQPNQYSKKGKQK